MIAFAKHSYNAYKCLKDPQTPISDISSTMHKLVPKMQTRKTVIHPLLVFLLLAASNNHQYSPVMVQAIRSDVGMKIGTAQSMHKTSAVYNEANQYTREQIQGTKIYKYPSGPNPTGHHHAPFKP